MSESKNKFINNVAVRSTALQIATDACRKLMDTGNLGPKSVAGEDVNIDGVRTMLNQSIERQVVTGE